MLSLCTPCLEAVARLWKIANSVTESCARQGDKVQAEVQGQGRSHHCRDTQFRCSMRMPMSGSTLVFPP